MKQCAKFTRAMFTLFSILVWMSIRVPLAAASPELYCGSNEEQVLAERLSTDSMIARDPLGAAANDARVHDQFGAVESRCDNPGSAAESFAFSAMEWWAARDFARAENRMLRVIRYDHVVLNRGPSAAKRRKILGNISFATSLLTKIRAHAIESEYEGNVYHR